MKLMHYSIGEAARASGLSIKAIRHYEAIGLIPSPSRRASSPGNGGHRVFMPEEIGRLRFVRGARMLGLKLADIRHLVAIAEADGCPGNRPEYREVLARHHREVSARIEQLSHLRDTLEALMTPEQSAGGGCTWATCGCMDAGEALSMSGTSAVEACGVRHGTKMGEDHV